MKVFRTEPVSSISSKYYGAREIFELVVFKRTTRLAPFSMACDIANCFTSPGCFSFLSSLVCWPSFFDVASEPEATNKGFREQQYRQQFISFDYLRISVIHTRAQKKRHTHTRTHTRIYSNPCSLVFMKFKNHRFEG